MTPATDAALVHARALRGRGSTLPPGFAPGAEILDSWARCLDSGLDYAARVDVPVVTAAELARRRDRAGVVRRLARTELDTLMQQIAGSDFLLAFADADGVILDALTDHRFSMSSNEDIVAGSTWREEVAGTNGLGTALAAGASVAVTGPEHYFLRLSNISCTACTIRDAAGAVVGVLDASSHVEARQRHTQALVQMACAQVESRLFTEQRADDFVIAIHPRREFLRTLSAGLLAFDGNGVLMALNARAQALLSGLGAAAGGTRFEQLFGERFSAFLARLHARSEVALHDVLGSALAATWVATRLTARAPVRDLVRDPVRVPVGGSEGGPALPRSGADAARAADPAGGVLVGRGIDAPVFVADDARVAAARRVFAQALRLRARALVRGASGSGKDALVREVLAAEGRDSALRVLAASAWSDGREAERALLEAARGQPARVVLVDGLDALLPDVQGAVRRALDALGDDDALVVFASVHDPAAEVEAGRLRADLRHRASTLEAVLPGLAERSDFDACAAEVLRRIAPVARLDEAALAVLRRHRWPGNFFELQNLLTRAWLAAQHDALQAAQQAVDGARAGGAAGGSLAVGAPVPQGPAAAPPEARAAEPLLVRAAHVAPLMPQAAPLAAAASAGSVLQREAAERVRRELERNGGSISRTARALGISRTTVYRHLRAAERDERGSP